MAHPLHLVRWCASVDEMPYGEAEFRHAYFYTPWRNRLLLRDATSGLMAESQALHGRRRKASASLGAVSAFLALLAALAARFLAFLTWRSWLLPVACR